MCKGSGEPEAPEVVVDPGVSSLLRSGALHGLRLARDDRGEHGAATTSLTERARRRRRCRSVRDLLAYGTEEQKRTRYPLVATGEVISAIAMSEPGASYDLQRIRTKVVV